MIELVSEYGRGAAESGGVDAPGKFVRPMIEQGAARTRFPFFIEFPRFLDNVSGVRSGASAGSDDRGSVVSLWPLRLETALTICR